MPIPAIAVQADGNVKVEAVIDRIGLGLADIILDAAAAQAGAGKAVGNGILGGNNAHILEPGKENFVKGQDFVAFRHILPQQRQQVPDQLLKVVRQFLFDAADAEVVVHHPRPGHRLKERLNPFPAAEGKHRRSHSPGVQADGTHIKQVAGDAVQLAEDNPDILGPFRHGQAHQLFHRHAIGQLVVEVSHIVQAVKKGDDLVVLLPLAQLFGTPVQVADMGFHGDDFLPVHPQHHPKDAVGRGMLRPHIQQHLHRLGISRPGSRQVGLGCDHRFFQILRVSGRIGRVTGKPAAALWAA